MQNSERGLDKGEVLRREEDFLESKLERVFNEIEQNLIELWYCQ